MSTFHYSTSELRLTSVYEWSKVRWNRSRFQMYLCPWLQRRDMPRYLNEVLPHLSVIYSVLDLAAAHILRLSCFADNLQVIFEKSDAHIHWFQGKQYHFSQIERVSEDEESKSWKLEYNYFYRPHFFYKCLLFTVYVSFQNWTRVHTIHVQIKQRAWEGVHFTLAFVRTDIEGKTVKVRIHSSMRRYNHEHLSISLAMRR